MLHLSEETLRALGVTSADMVAALEDVIRQSEANRAWAAPKAVLSPPDGRYVMATLAALADPPLVATKSLVLNARNSDIGLPQINSLVTLLHGETGQPLATMNGNWITALRTAGLSAEAAKYLANPDSSSIGLVGSGVQARSHLSVFAEMFPLKSVKVFGRGAQNLEQARALAESLDLTVETYANPREAVEDVDLVVTSVTHTAVTEPFLDAAWLSPRCFAAVADLAAPWHKDSFASLDRLAIDDLAQEASLPNKLAHPGDIDGDLAGLIVGRMAGRQAPDERTAFVFRGHALGDLGLAALAWAKHNGH